MIPDQGHIETDKLIAEMEKKLAREYRKAVKEVKEKLDDYLERFEKKDAIWRRRLANGEVTQAEYNKWRTGQIMIRGRWEEMRQTLAQDLFNVNQIARSIVEGYMPEIYALNHNYATFQVETAGKVDTSYTLYNREAVERIMRTNPDLLPPPGKRMSAILRNNPAIAWQEGQIQSVMMQAILQGESIPNIAARIANTMGEMNHKDSIRYARTAATGAQNAGREDAYLRAAEMGVQMTRQWVATLDGRTRHEHRMLDGQIRAIGEPFEVDGFKIMFPGDPSAPGHLVWNCRCRTVANVKGWTSHSRQTRSMAALDGMTYEEWKQGHSVSRPIDYQENVGRAIRYRYINDLYKGK